jgi:hypothetical protein
VDLWYFLDPAIPNADYGIESFLVKTYGEAKGKNYLKQYEGFMASAGQIHFFETGKGLTPPSVSSEEEAIKKVIIDEMDAYLTSNLEAWANAQMQTPYHSTLHKFAKVSSSVGWDKKYEDAKKTFGTPNDIAYKKSYIKVNRTDWNIQIRGNVAWARWKDMWDMTNGSELPMYNLKVLEKQNNQWRVAHVGVYTAPEETFNQAKEEEAIKQVIEGENAAFNAGDVEKTRSFFNFQPYNIGMLTTQNGVTVYKAGEEVNNFYKSFKASKITATHSNFNIKITGNTAWETNDQTQMEDGKVLLTSHQMRCLEKVNGAWKIVTFSAHHSKPN